MAGREGASSSPSIRPSDMRVVPPPWARSDQHPTRSGSSLTVDARFAGVTRGASWANSSRRSEENSYEKRQRMERYEREKSALESLRRSGHTPYGEGELEEWEALTAQIRHPSKTLRERFLPGGNTLFQNRLAESKQKLEAVNRRLSDLFGEYTVPIILNEWNRTKPIRTENERIFRKKVDEGIERDRRENKNTKDMIKLLGSKGEIRTKPYSEAAVVMKAFEYLYDLNQRFPEIKYRSWNDGWSSEQKHAYQEANRVRNELGQRFGTKIYEGEYKSNLDQVIDAYEKYRERLRGTDSESQSKATKEMLGILKSKKAIKLSEYHPMGMAFKTLKQLDQLMSSPIYRPGDPTAAEQRDKDVNRLRNVLGMKFGYGDLDKVVLAYRDYKYRTTPRT